MDDSHTDTLDSLTRSAVFSSSEEDLKVTVIGLTIAGHPEIERIGERAPLLQPSDDEPTELSRLTPLFAAPGKSHGHPLADPHVSRRPLRLRCAADGSVEVLNAFDLRVDVDGERLGAERRLTPGHIERGAVLTIAGRVVLLLHQLEFATGDRPCRGLIGESPGIRRLRRHIQRVADLDVPVLLRGETGTGKELVAHSIFEASRRCHGPLVAVNMGAVPATLAAAELFGSSKGAFTGADRKRRGYFVEADGGTLFLDEIGETPPEVQPLLLRTLETGLVRAVGSAGERRVDVRIIAATDADLEREIEAGRFRAPLLHRLAGYEIRLPTLRERREDVPRLMVHFLRQESAALGEDWPRPARGRSRPWLPTSIITRFLSYAWPGNVRQLRNLTRQLLIANRGRSRLRLTPEIEQQLDASSADLTEVPTRRAPAADAGSPVRAEPAAPPTDRWVIRALVCLRWREPPKSVRRQARRDRLVREHLARFDGHEIERGGGFLLLFVRPVDALAFALDVHAGLAALEPPQRAAAGLCVGEVLQHSNDSNLVARGAGRFDVAGAAKAGARELADLALDGQTLLDQSAFELARLAFDKDASGHTHGRSGGGLRGDELVWLDHGTVAFARRRSKVFEVGDPHLAPLTRPADDRMEPDRDDPAAAYRSPREIGEEELITTLRRHAFRLQPTAKALRISRTSLYALIEASPRIRKAKDISREEIVASRERHGGDRGAMAAELEVSRKGLSRRMTQLGL